MSRPTIATGSTGVIQGRVSDAQGAMLPGVTIVAVPVLNGKGTISHTIAAVGLGSQLDRPTSLALARDMRVVAEAIAPQLAIHA